MDVFFKKRGMRFTIAAWAIAAEEQGVELEQMSELENNTLFWAIVRAAARYYAMTKGKKVAKWRINLLQRRMAYEHAFLSAKGKSEKSAISRCSKAIEHVIDTKKKRMKEKETSETDN